MTKMEIIRNDDVEDGNDEDVKETYKNCEKKNQESKKELGDSR